MRALALALALVLVGSACAEDDTSTASPEDAGASTTGEPTSGGSITVGLESETNSYFPSIGSWSQSAYNVAYAIFDPLVVRTTDGTIEPFLAESLQSVSEDQTEWQVVLRPGVQFHDGTTLDARVLKTIFDEYLSVEGAIVPPQLTNVREVRVVDELTAVYVLEEPDSGFPDLLAEVAGMPFSVAAAKESGTDPDDLPKGTGPFMVEEWIPDDRIVLVANPNYWREGLPHLDSITFRPIPDERSRVQALLTGVIDGMQTLRGSTIRELRENEDEGVTGYMTVGDEAGISVMNTAKPPFDDPRIRRAFAHTVDQEEVAEVLGEDGLVPVASQYFSEDSPWYSERVAATRPAFDMEEAKRLVAEYANDPERSDGAPLGQSPELDYGCLKDPTLIRLATLTTNNAKRAGFDVDTITVEQPELVADTTGSPTEDPPFRGDFFVNCYRILPHGSPAATFGAIYGPPDVSPNNLSNYDHPDLTRMIDELRRAENFADQYALVEEIGIHINEAATVTYGLATPAMIGVRNAVKNVDGWTLPDGSVGTGARRGITRWGQVWLEE